jgi:acetyltransferase EpsM
MQNNSPVSVVLLGAGGHAKVVADLCIAGGHKIAGYLDDEKPIKSQWVGGTIIGSLSLLQDAAFIADHWFIPTIGDNSVRRYFAQQLNAAGAKMLSVVHSSAVISPFASIGDGTVIMPCAVVNAAVKIGDFCILNTGCTVDHDCVIEDGCQICPGVNLAGNVRCEQDVFVGTGVSIIPNIRVGERAVIGAGSVVIRDVESGITVTGNPAKVRGQ